MKRALIVIDVQKGFVNKITKPVIKKIQTYINAQWTSYDLIIFTQYKNHSKSNFVKNMAWHGFMTKKENDLVDEVKDFVNRDNLFIKDTYGSFVDDRVLNSLKEYDIQQVELVGFDTENCVLTFARDAFDRGFKVVVLKDLCASHAVPKLHKAALEIIEENIGIVK